MKVNLDLIRDNKRAGFFPIKQICSIFESVYRNANSMELTVDLGNSITHEKSKRVLYYLDQIDGKLFAIDPVIINDCCFMTNEIVDQCDSHSSKSHNDLFVNHLKFYDYDNEKFYNRFEWVRSWGLDLNTSEVTPGDEANKFTIFKINNNSKSDCNFGRYLRDENGVIVLDSYKEASEFVQKEKSDQLEIKNNDFFCGNEEEDSEYYICDAEK